MKTESTADHENDVIKQIIREYEVDGSIRWRQAFAEHPDWQAALAHLRMPTIYVRANQFRGRKKPAARMLPVVAGPKRGRRRGMPPIPADEQAILEQLVEQYGSGRSIEFMQAFREHPEWEKALAHISLPAIRSRGHRIKKQMQLAQKQQRKARAVAQDVELVPVQRNGHAPVLSAPPEPSGVCFCPRCGEDIGRWNRVSQVIERLPQ